MKKIFMAGILVALLATEINGQAPIMAPGGVQGTERYLPFMLTGGGYCTIFASTNLSPEARQIGVAAFGQDGQKLRLAPEGGLGFVVVLSGKEAGYTTGLSSPTELNVGWVRFTQPIDSNGVAETQVSPTLGRFNDKGECQPFVEELTTVGASSRGAFYGRENTGVSFVNPGETTLTVSLTRKGGETVVLTLEPKGQAVLLLGERFGRFDGGGFEFSSTGFVAVLATEPIVGNRYRAVSVETAK